MIVAEMIIEGVDDQRVLFKNIRDQTEEAMRKDEMFTTSFLELLGRRHHMFQTQRVFTRYFIQVHIFRSGDA